MSSWTRKRKLEKTRLAFPERRSFFSTFVPAAPPDTKSNAAVMTSSATASASAATASDVKTSTGATAPPKPEVRTDAMVFWLKRTVHILNKPKVAAIQKRIAAYHTLGQPDRARILSERMHNNADNYVQTTVKKLFRVVRPLRFDHLAAAVMSPLSAYMIEFPTGFESKSKVSAASFAVLIKGPIVLGLPDAGPELKDGHAWMIVEWPNPLQSAKTQYQKDGVSLLDAVAQEMQLMSLDIFRKFCDFVILDDRFPAECSTCTASAERVLADIPANMKDNVPFMQFLTKAVVCWPCCHGMTCIHCSAAHSTCPFCSQTPASLYIPAHGSLLF